MSSQAHKTCALLCITFKFSDFPQLVFALSGLFSICSTSFACFLPQYWTRCLLLLFSVLLLLLLLFIICVCVL